MISNETCVCVYHSFELFNVFSNAIDKIQLLFLLVSVLSFYYYTVVFKAYSYVFEIARVRCLCLFFCYNLVYNLHSHVISLTI